jgi:hypothetical protein
LFNITQLFTDGAELIGEVALDETQLSAGQNVALPATIVVGSTGGKPIYLVGELSETKPASSGLTVPNGFNIGTIFSDLITVYGDVSIDEAELASGQTVPIPAILEVGSIKSVPVYLLASLTTTKPAPGGLSV